jgi:Tetracyclin repressor-like, C-terminal domain
MLDRVILDGVTAGEFTTPYPADASRSIASLCVGVATWYRPDGGLSVEELLERYRSIARSIVGHAGRPSPGSA